MYQRICLLSAILCLGLPAFADGTNPPPAELPRVSPATPTMPAQATPSMQDAILPDQPVPPHLPFVIDDMMIGQNSTESARLSDDQVLHQINFYLSETLTFTREMNLANSSVDQHGTIVRANGKLLDTITIPAGTKCIAKSITREKGLFYHSITLAIYCGKTKSQKEDSNTISFMAVDESSLKEDRTFRTYGLGQLKLFVNSNFEYAVQPNKAILLVDRQYLENDENEQDALSGASHD